MPDVRSPKFVAEAHRQAALVGSSTPADRDQAFIEAISPDEE